MECQKDETKTPIIIREFHEDHTMEGTYSQRAALRKLESMFYERIGLMDPLAKTEPNPILIDIHYERKNVLMMLDYDQKEKAVPNGNSEQPKRLWCQCGAELTKTCSRCDSRFSEKANYCGNCGAKLVEIIR